MGEDAFGLAASPLPSSLQRPAVSSLRLLGLLKQPDDPDPDAFPPHQLELDESEVVWSSDDLFSYSSPPSVDCSSADRFSSPDVVRSPLTPSSCSPSPGRVRHQFTPERCGLSAALAAEDLLPLVRQRRPASAAAAARATRPVVVPAGMGPEATLLVGRMGYHQSAPVNVPAWPRWRKEQKADALEGLGEEGRWGKPPVEVEEEEEDREEEEMVPPHVIVARSHVTTFSVFEGVGRTLKGRDLRRVRNAVLQKTGFLDI